MLKINELNRRDLVDCDACVLDETPDHIVLSVRVDKKTIRNNLHLLAAVSDLSAPESSGGMIERFAKAVKRRHKFPAWAACGIAFIAIFFNDLELRLPRLNASPVQPVEIGESYAMPETVRQGEQLHMMQSSRRLRNCFGEFDRVITSADGNIVTRAHHNGLPAFKDEGWVIKERIVDLPADIALGDYLHQIQIRSHCDDGIFHAVSKPAPFRVVAP